MTEQDVSPPAQATESGFTYRIITRYWPRIAAGLVVLAGISEWVIGGLTANGALQFYVFAWAATTGGLWFVAEKAEAALSGEARSAVVGRVRASSLDVALGAIPDQFGVLFDRVFGEKHWSRSCFNRSCLASYLGFLFLFGLKLTFGSWGRESEAVQFARFLVPA